MNRTGPHPLLVHIGSAAAGMSGIHSYASAFDAKYDEEDIINMMRGIQAYQSHSYQSDRCNLHQIWQRRCVSILSVSPERQPATVATPLLIIPSLVNRSYVFNLNQRRSFVMHAHRAGVPVYLLDWGDVNGSEGISDMNEIIAEILPQAISYIQERYNRKVNLLGYCMGGALALGAMCIAPQHIEDCILLATPWNFHADKAELNARIRSWAPYALSSIEQKGYLPDQWIQALFASLDPDSAVKKFANFAAMDMDSDEAKLFIDVEDWLNDNVAMPNAIAQHCIQEWFAKNVLMHNDWFVGGRHIDFSAIQSRVLMLASENDKLVPHHSAQPVLQALTSAKTDCMKLSCGHIGFIAGRRAVEDVWNPIIKWLQKK